MGVIGQGGGEGETGRELQESRAEAGMQVAARPGRSSLPVFLLTPGANACSFRLPRLPFWALSTRRDRDWRSGRDLAFLIRRASPHPASRCVMPPRALSTVHHRARPLRSPLSCQASALSTGVHDDSRAWAAEVSNHPSDLSRQGLVRPNATVMQPEATNARYPPPHIS